MPSDKRARQRAQREAKRAAEQKQAKRKRLMKNVTWALVAIVVVGSTGWYFFHPKPTPPPAPLTPQQRANNLAVAAGCSANPHTRANELSWKSEPALSLAPHTSSVAVVKTTAGSFTVALNTTTTPHNTNNFIFLARHDFYHCVIFHRVIPGFMNQGGDPTGTGTGGPGYVVKQNEFPTAVASADAAHQYKLGAVAMANSCSQSTPASSCPPTNGSQFFIVAGAQGEALPPRYTDFGQVISGMSTIDKINAEGDINAASDGTGTNLKVTNRILSVTITTTSN